jgi:hypothetical protein|mmetsp:Transcript_11336/g.20856  ORF Transcript_11336/g.20856 Transcript_11336/m.20856 type:complete len:85 (-) Transcript_11336:140-394(-)
MLGYPDPSRHIFSGPVLLPVNDQHHAPHSPLQKENNTTMPTNQVFMHLLTHLKPLDQTSQMKFAGFGLLQEFVFVHFSVPVLFQ